MNVEASYRKELQSILDHGIWLNNTRLGNVQIYDHEKGVLEIVAQKGFRQDFLDHFREVKAVDHSACGRALGSAQLIKVDDVQTDQSFVPHRAIAMSANFRSVVSQPIISDGRVILGVVSLHFSKPRQDWDNLCISPMVNEMIRVLEKVRQNYYA
jgi:GAF domain-containing protein